MNPEVQCRESSNSRQFFIKVSRCCKWRTATVPVPVPVQWEMVADRIKSQWRTLGEQMEDEMIPESCKCDGRRIVERLEKGWYNWC